MRAASQIDVSLTEWDLVSQNEVWPYRMKSGFTEWGLASQNEAIFIEKEIYIYFCCKKEVTVFVAKFRNTRFEANIFKQMQFEAAMKIMSA